MTTFDEREKGFEKKFAHDQNLKFKAESRRNRLIGHWAAEKLGITGDDVAAYAKTVIKADLEGECTRAVELCQKVSSFFQW